MTGARPSSAVPPTRLGVTARHLLLARDITESILAHPGERSTQVLALRLADLEARAVKAAIMRTVPAWLWFVLGAFAGLGLSEWWPGP